MTRECRNQRLYQLFTVTFNNKKNTSAVKKSFTPPITRKAERKRLARANVSPKTAQFFPPSPALAVYRLFLASRFYPDSDGFIVSRRWGAPPRERKRAQKCMRPGWNAPLSIEGDSRARECIIRRRKCIMRRGSALCGSRSVVCLYGRGWLQVRCMGGKIGAWFFFKHFYGASDQCGRHAKWEITSFSGEKIYSSVKLSRTWRYDIWVTDATLGVACLLIFEEKKSKFRLADLSSDSIVVMTGH